MFERAKKGYKPPKPVKQRINIYLPPELVEGFTDWCNANGYKRNELIECILEDYLQRYGKKDDQ